jgi:clan AA aspartic protease
VIAGVVNANLEPVIALRIRSMKGIEIDMDAVVDTGFSGFLTLPTQTVSTLGLSRYSVSSAMLADGTVRHFDLFQAEVLWNNTWRRVLVTALGTEVLAGMQLLEGHELRVVARVNGPVSISLLP